MLCTMATEDAAL